MPKPYAPGRLKWRYRAKDFSKSRASEKTSRSVRESMRSFS